MRTVLALMNRNRKLFFKDKGMLFTSMITPVILIVLYATFLAKVFYSYFLTFEDGARIEIMNLPEMADLPKKIVRTGYSHIAFSVGSIEIVDALTAELKADGYEVISGPRTTGDGYYESCIVAVEDNQIEITV